MSIPMLMWYTAVLGEVIKTETTKINGGVRCEANQ